MKKKVATIALILIAPMTGAQSEDLTLAQCKALKDSIRYYDQLRRDGGNSAQMSRWQKKRNEKRDLFGDARCLKKYGKKVR